MYLLWPMGVLNIWAVKSVQLILQKRKWCCLSLCHSDKVHIKRKWSTLGKNGEGSPITIERVCLHIFLQRNYIECFILVSWVVVFAGGWGQWQNHPCSSSKEEMCTIFYYTVHSKIIKQQRRNVYNFLLYILHYMS